MRPLRLHLEGFASFRDPCDIDFSDAELFVITGPTGAGKSSLIDAMTFALYGSVPRLDARTVFPVITTGKSEARVAFEFAVGDEEYTAARVVRRTKTGASTKEAKEVCRGCVVREDCLEYALVQGEKFGIWGGMSERERRRLRRQRALARRAAAGE